MSRLGRRISRGEREERMISEVMQVDLLSMLESRALFFEWLSHEWVTCSFREACCKYTALIERRIRVSF